MRMRRHRLQSGRRYAASALRGSLQKQSSFKQSGPTAVKCVMLAGPHNVARPDPTWLSTNIHAWVH